MHQLYAQADNATVRTLIWHAVCRDRAGVSLCGIRLEPRPAGGETDQGAPEALDRYCPSCMEAVRAAMTSAKDGQHAC